MKALQVFRIVATEFADVPDETVEAWLELTEPMVSRRVFGRLYEQALALLAAHRMKMSGKGDNSLGSVADALRVASYSEGETSISFSGGAGAGGTTDSELSMTQYGIDYLYLRGLVVIPIRSAGEA